MGGHPFSPSFWFHPAKKNCLPGREVNRPDFPGRKTTQLEETKYDK